MHPPVPVRVLERLADLAGVSVRTVKSDRAELAKAQSAIDRTPIEGGARRSAGSASTSWDRVPRAHSFVYAVKNAKRPDARLALPFRGALKTGVVDG